MSKAPSDQVMNFSLDNNVTQAKVTYSSTPTRSVIVVILYISISYINGTLVHTFTKHQVLYENSRYILFIHLVLNDTIQLTIAALLFIVSQTLGSINVSFCCILLIIAIFATINTPLNLTCMAIERYIAICHPFQHSKVCTVHRTFILIGFIWAMAGVHILPDLILLLALAPLSFFHSSVFCSRDFVFHYPLLIEKRNISHMVYLSFVGLTLVYTYLRVMFAAKAVSSDAKKARNTIILHGIQLLICLLTYIYPVFTVWLNKFIPHFIQYIIVHMLPRFISPIIYGVRDQTFLKYFKRYMLCTTNKVDINTNNQTTNL